MQRSKEPATSRKRKESSSKSNESKSKKEKLLVENLTDQFDDKSVTDEFNYLPTALPKLPFRLCLSGVSGNGKTNLILNLVGKFYVDQGGETVFKRGIHIFSPSVTTDKAYKALVKMCSSWVDDGLLNMYDDIDLDLIHNLVSNFEENGEALIIIDDAAASDVLNSKAFDMLYLRSRHKHNSWIITTQMFRLLRKEIRNNFTDFIVYNVINDHELRLIEHELVTNKVNLDTIQKQLHKLNQFEFLHKDVRSNKWYVGLSTDEFTDANTQSVDENKSE